MFYSNLLCLCGKVYWRIKFILKYFIEILVIGKLAARWNVPIIAHMSGEDALADRSVYKTMSSVALTSAIEMARATITFLELNGWKQVSYYGDI